MGSFSVWHWLVVVLIVGVFGFFFAAMSRSRVRSFLFARAERRAYARQQTPPDEPTPSSIRFRLWHWLIIVLVGAVPIIDIALRDYGLLSDLPLRGWLIAILFGVGIAFFVAAVIKFRLWRSLIVVMLVACLVEGALWRDLYTLVFFLIVGVFGFFFAAMSRSRVRSFLFARAERRAYAGPQTPLDELTPGFIALPYLMSFWALAILFGLTLVPTVDLSVFAHPDKFADHSLTLALIANAANLCGLFLVLSGLLVHFRPNHSRELKYSLIMAYIPLIILVFIPSSLGRRYASDGDMAFLEVTVSLIIAFWFVIGIFMIAVLGGMWIRRHASDGQRPPDRMEQFLFTFIRMRYAGPIIVLCYFLSKEVMLILLMIRYVAIERFRRQPVIYLRSFHHDDATEVFGRAIAPAIAHLGVVKGLVHSQQTSGALLSRTSIWQFGLMATVPNEHWQDWVTKALRSARLVIIDCSILTESVMWEIGAALQHVNRQCVLIITNDKAPIGVDTSIDAEIMSYGQGPRAMAQLRSDITTWAKAALPGSPSRLLVRVAVLAWLCVLLVACGHLALTITPAFMSFGVTP